MSDEARASLTRLSEAVFSGLAKEGCDAAALAEQQVDCCTLQVVSIKWHKGRGPPPKKTSKRKQKRRIDIIGVCLFRLGMFLSRFKHIP